jgi:hypothetical protein
MEIYSNLKQLRLSIGDDDDESLFQIIDIRQLDALVTGGRPASPIQYSTCIQHAERTQPISGLRKCARIHDKAKRHKVSGICLGFGREDGNLSHYSNPSLMV